jgi:hypothetical protein
MMNGSITATRSLSSRRLERHGGPAWLALSLLFWSCSLIPTFTFAQSSSGTEGLQIEITKIGLGKEVVMTEGAMEWFMRVEVTPENTVVVRQEKQGERYLIDESETHDRSMTAVEVDAAITDFINHVKVKRQKP